MGIEVGIALRYEPLDRQVRGAGRGRSTSLVTVVVEAAGGQTLKAVRDEEVDLLSNDKRVAL